MSAPQITFRGGMEYSFIIADRNSLTKEFVLGIITLAL